MGQEQQCGFPKRYLNERCHDVITPTVRVIDPNNPGRPATQFQAHGLVLEHLDAATPQLPSYLRYVAHTAAMVVIPEHRACHTQGPATEEATMVDRATVVVVVTGERDEVRSELQRPFTSLPKQPFPP